jgi:subtilase family protein
MKLSKKVLILSISLFLIGSFCYAADLIPNDPDFNKQWYLEHLNIPQIWSQQTGNSSVVVAVIDSGVEVSHPDLHDNIWINRNEILGDNIDNDNNGYIDDFNGWDFLGDDNDPSPSYFKNCLRQQTCVEEAIIHGTFVSGIISAVGNNHQGISGISWKTKIMPLRVLGPNGSGNTFDVIDAVNYAVDNGADIINLSFVGDAYDQAFELTLERAYNEGVLIIVAAGNENISGQPTNLDLFKMYPVCHQGRNNENIVLGVGATDADNKLTPYSSYGSRCMDMVAPGDSFWGAIIDDPEIKEFTGYYGGEYSGTSLAAPVVTGMAALIKSFSPALKNTEIMDLILNNTDNIDDINPDFAGKLGKGLLSPVKIWQSLMFKAGQYRLIKGSNSAVYYQAIDNKRYIFPSKDTFFSWYDNFDQVIQVADSELAEFQIGGNITLRPGVKLVKITTDPKVYAVGKGGILRWVTQEDLARQMYGPNWQSSVMDISDAFFFNYQIGEDIIELTDFNPIIEQNQVISIDQDLGLFK